ncbi:hypothetical protein GMI70_07120 [Eggerthellaceae bacterium zg-893]|nr:hypothetical protein [Eggerthellaceae bacterium zg-893]
MHTFEQIRNEIDVVDGGTFQVLAQRCCLRKYGFKSAHYYGTKAGCLKTIKGHPDSFYETDAGGWAFLEAGHVSDRVQAAKKIQEDIKTCLDYEKQHSDMGALDLIICCYSCPRFTPADMNALRGADPRVLLVGPDDIAEMCVAYPWLAHEYLGIETGATQICDLDGFISLAEKDSFAPSLKTELTGRSQEIEDLLQIIEVKQAICLTGKSGSGKTKLAIEMCAQYSAAKNAEMLVIRPSRKPIYEALERCCTSGSKYIVLLDDANDLADLSLVREYVSLHENIKIVATARSYAKQYVVKELRHLQTFEEYPVVPVANEIIEDVLQNQLGITNHDYIQQIVRAAHGNMRLAVLAGESAKVNGFQGIANIHDLLKACYEKKLEEFSAHERSAIAISSILGAHMTANNKDLDALESRASIDHAQYMEACRSLHRKELLDMIHNFSAVDFEEQNLRDYFIRLAIVEEGVFRLKDILSLSDGENLIVHALNVILGVFYTEKARDDLASQMREIWDEADEAGRVELVKRFGSLIPLDSLSFLAVSIQSVDSNPDRFDYLSIGLEKKPRYGFESSILECVASFFNNHEYWQLAVNLMFDLLEKDNGYTGDYCFIFDSLLKPNHSLLSASIIREQHVLDRLKSLHKETSDATYAVLLLRYAQNILSDEIEEVEPGEGNQVIFYKVMLQHSDELAALRKDCISALLSLRRIPAYAKMADSVVFGYRGQSTDREPSLAAETCRMIIDNYRLSEIPVSYSCLQKIWEFRRSHKRILSEFGWIDDLFDANCATKLVSYLQEPAYRLSDPEDELESELQELIAPMADSDWRSFLGLLQADQTDSSGVDYRVSRMLTWAIGYYRNYDIRIQKLLLDAFLSIGISPWYDFDTILSSLGSLYHSADIRQVIIEKVPSGLVASWLANYDTSIFMKTDDCSTFASNVLSGLSEYGELVNFENIVRADLAQPGFLGEYCQALTDSTMVSPSQLCHYPASMDETAIPSLNMSLDHRENLVQFEKLLCFLLANSADCWHSEKLCICAVEKDPSFIREILRIWIERNAEVHFASGHSIDELYWSVPSPIETLALLPQIHRELSHDFSSKYYFKKCTSSIVKTGIDKGYRTCLIEWLSSEAVSQSPFSEIAIDIGASLSYADRTDFCIALCEKRAPMENFVEAAISMPFNGVSWSGSEVPLIDKRIEYVNNLASLLLKKGFSQYCSELQNHLRCLQNSKSTVEIREFINHF